MITAIGKYVYNSMIKHSASNPSEQLQNRTATKNKKPNSHFRKK